MKGKATKILLLMLILACVIPAIGEATGEPQRRRTQRRPAPKPTPTPPPDYVAHANAVAEQLKLVSRFVYTYGKIVNGLEFASGQAKAGNTSPQLEAQNQQAKQSIVNNINGLRAGINKVVEQLHADQRLQVQYLKLGAAADAIATAEQLSAAGKFDEAGKALLVAIDRLSDTIIALR